ncbi:SDR family oxidoreductase [Brasilonema sp. UFV-L1]|uniref:SDR family oxidoreductase n=1 Tax=Brasilonema sp. UFV-L1 TaxID=2234130 RepID=UPI00145DE965|nr:SDR family oxidoreductase [Brasilonema sp. UFV-L1]NMG08484.1 hypothetical protein [Brasilonema sp. UFV-L1]
MTQQTKDMSSQPIIVVSGATGNTGKHVVKLLSQVKDVKVRAAVHSLEKARELPENVEVVQMDYAQPETVVSAFAGATKLYLVPPSDPNRVRSEIAPIMVEAAKKAGIQYIVLISGLGIDREPITPTDREFYLQVEGIVVDSGITHTILRCSWFHQNFISPVFFGPQVQQGVVRLPVGEGRTGWIDARDIAAVAATVLTQTGHENKIYNLTGPEALTTSELTTILSKAAAREIKFMDVSEESFAQMLRNFGTRELLIQGMIDIMGKWKIGAHDIVTPDVEKVTGKKPISFEQFAIDQAHLLRQSDSSGHEVLAT